MSEPLEKRTPLAWGRNDSLPGGRDAYPPILDLGDPVSGGASAGAYPFDVKATNATHFTVRTGTVNGFVPTNIATSFVMVGSGTEYVVIDCVATDGKITGATISVSTTPPVGIPVVSGQPPTNFSLLIAVLVNGVPFRIIGNGSITATPFESYRLQKAMPTPDSLPYDSYYTWKTSVT